LLGVATAAPDKPFAIRREVREKVRGRVVGYSLQTTPVSVDDEQVKVFGVVVVA
jgi:hypothetical protein